MMRNNIGVLVQQRQETRKTHGALLTLAGRAMIQQSGQLATHARNGQKVIGSPLKSSQPELPSALAHEKEHEKRGRQANHTTQGKAHATDMRGYKFHLTSVL